MATTFTPEQIAQILEEFFNTVGTRQYVGARYVPIFGRKDEESIEWDNTGTYEPLTIVLYQGNSYTSRQYVPVGVEITNQEFWALTGNYNAQVEQYRRETAAAKETADSALEAAGNAQQAADNAQLAADNAQQAADNAQQAADNAQQAADAASALANVIDYQTTIEPRFFGRIFNEVNALEAQGMCIVDDANAYAVFGQGDNASDPSAVVYKFNPTNGNIIEHFARDFYHCNDMCYNVADGYVYVVRRATTTDTILLKCSATSLNIVESIDTGIVVLGCAYDRMTEKMYIYGGSGGTYTVYEFDPTTVTKSEAYTITTAELGYSIQTQGLVAYDDTVSIIFSGPSMCQLVSKRGGKLLARNVSNSCFLYTAYEWQSADYTPDGTLFINSMAYAYRKLCMCIGMYRDGMPIDQNYDLSMVKRDTLDSYLQPAEINANIRASGRYNSPLATFDELLRFVELVGGRVNLTGSGSILIDNAYSIPFNLTLLGNSSVKLNLVAAITCWGNIIFRDLDIDYTAASDVYIVTAHALVNFHKVNVKCLSTSATNRFMAAYMMCSFTGCAYTNETQYQSYVMNGGDRCLFTNGANVTGFNYTAKGVVL